MDVNLKRVIDQGEWVVGEWNDKAKQLGFPEELFFSSPETESEQEKRDWEKCIHDFALATKLGDDKDDEGIVKLPKASDIPGKLVKVAEPFYKCLLTRDRVQKLVDEGVEALLFAAKKQVQDSTEETGGVKQTTDAGFEAWRKTKIADVLSRLAEIRGENFAEVEEPKGEGELPGGILEL